VTDKSEKLFFMEAKHTRSIKIQHQYRPSRSKFMSGPSRAPRHVPWLNLRGVWLERAGFYAGDRVEIRVSNNRLTIINLGQDGDI
jgi:toxic protein SymE